MWALTDVSTGSGMRALANVFTRIFARFLSHYGNLRILAFIVDFLREERA
jgi:hypothetical protein